MIKQNVEVEVQPAKKPAKVLNNKARAIYQDRGLIVAPAERKPSTHISVTTDTDTSDKSLEEMARNIYQLFREPFKRRVADGAILYNTTQAITLSDGREPVLPPAYDTAIWRLTHDGQLQIRQDDYETETTTPSQTHPDAAVLADGAATDSVDAVQFQYYRRTADGDTVVETADGNVIANTATGADVSAWTPIYFPHVPVDIHYLHDTTIYYRERDRLHEMTVSPDWLRADMTVTERVTNAVGEFVDRYTVSVAGTELRKDALITAFRDWYAELPGTQSPARQTIGTALTEIGWGKDDGQKRRNVDEAGGQKIFMDGMSWRIPRQIYSPEHPFVAAESDP